MQDQKFTLPFPPLQVRAGVLVVDGYGISTRVLYGKLRVEDGIGPHRRAISLDRAGSGLERLVLLGKTGTLTLESLAWLRAIGAALVHLSPDGQVLTHSVPFGYEGLVRRSQALAIANGLDVEVARELIRRKLDGQRANLVRLRVRDLCGFDSMREALDGVGQSTRFACARRKRPQSTGTRGRTWGFVCERGICPVYRYDGHGTNRESPRLPGHLGRRLIR